jgi:hypothetical protein
MENTKIIKPGQKIPSKFFSGLGLRRLEQNHKKKVEWAKKK